MPGFFGEQATRLLRERWNSAQELAEELFAMSGITGPMSTDRTIVIYRNGEEPAIRIIDNSSGNSPPIQIIRRNDPPYDWQQAINIYPPPDPGGGGGGGQEEEEEEEDDGQSGPGDGEILYPAEPPEPTGGRMFTATLKIIVHANEPDPFNFDGLVAVFTNSQCFPYSPPLAPAPTTAFQFPGIIAQLNAYTSLPTLAPYFSGYTIVYDLVSSPGASC